MSPVFLSAMYVGRFAPSPSGRLHFGSLVAALGSYLRARHENGRILLRIEDLDFYRCKKEYTSLIINELHTLGFEYDGETYIQSEHTDVYLEKAKELIDKGEAYYCHCTRAMRKQEPCHCKELHLQQTENTNYALNYEVHDVCNNTFEDELLGKVHCEYKTHELTLIRTDRVISYNLGCVVDDILEGVTEIVRGADLIDITPAQLSLYSSFNKNAPRYLHLPLIMQDSERKLSKQNHSPAVLDLASPQKLLITGLKFLNQETEDLNEDMSVYKILSKAVDRFCIEKISKRPLLMIKLQHSQ